MFLQKGFQDFFPKPIDTVKLNAVLEKWIPAAKQQSAMAAAACAPKDILAPAMLLPAIAGVDAAAGAAKVGGSPARYRELLHAFRQDAAARFALLATVPDRTGLHAFTTFVHALKSGLAMIGANALSESAAVLEQAGRNGEPAVIQNHLAAFREDLAALMARIGEITAVGGSGPSGEDEPAALLVGLQAALQARDTDGIDVAIADLRKLSLNPSTYAAVTDIAHHVLFGDLKKAAEAVSALLERGN
jgi:HPt (histidine-containing phosphotransfer) domain-containing protein